MPDVNELWEIPYLFEKRNDKGQPGNMKKLLRQITPGPIWQLMKFVYHELKKLQYLTVGQPFKPGETAKAKQRRTEEGFFDKYCQGKGLDIGYGGDLLAPNCKGWDREHGDAQYLHGMEDASFDFVYSSHTLEHMVNPGIALRNWWRVLKPGGYLILYIPHRDLYEKKKTLPSRWNNDHKHFFLTDTDEEPDTIGIIPLIQRTLANQKVIYAKECNAGHTITDPEIHSDGEYSIEVVIKKE